MSQIDTLENIRKHLIKALEYDELQIPVLPRVASEVLSLSQDPDADIDSLSKLIYQDQAIASHVLQIANSAAFAGSSRIDSLDMAVARLGMQLLSEIAFSVSLQKNIFNQPQHKELVGFMWKHSLASAIYAKQIARITGHNAETLYLCGLLHEIGKPITLFVIGNLPLDGYQPTNEEIKLLIEEFHMSVGAIVTRQWDLPEIVQIANLNYPHPTNAPKHTDEVRITYLADLLTQYVLTDEPSLRQIMDDPIFEELNISEDDQENIFGLKDSVIERISSMVI